MLTCICGKSTEDTMADFCSACGVRYPKEAKLPCVGTVSTRGIYRITFAPQEAEFNHDESVQEVIRKSVWNEDNEFKGNTKVEFVRSTVTPKTHPYECGTCKAGNENMVSETTEGYCEFCNEVNWLRRKTD